MTPPKYLTGDKAAINEFIDQFDVGPLVRIMSPFVKSSLTVCP